MLTNGVTLKLITCIWGETGHGIINAYQVLQNNPSDTALLKSGVKKHKRLFRKRLKAGASDHGFYS